MPHTLWHANRDAASARINPPQRKPCNSRSVRRRTPDHSPSPRRQRGKRHTRAIRHDEPRDNSGELGLHGLEVGTQYRRVLADDGHRNGGKAHSDELRLSGLIFCNVSNLEIYAALGKEPLHLSAGRSTSTAVNDNFHIRHDRSPFCEMVSEQRGRSRQAEPTPITPGSISQHPHGVKERPQPALPAGKEVSAVSKIHARLPIDKFRKSLRDGFRIPDYQLHTCQSDFFRHNGGLPVRKESFAPGQAPRSPVLSAGPRSLAVILGSADSFEYETPSRPDKYS